MKKKILYFSNEFANGGIKTLCYDISKNIDKRNFKIDYFFVNSHGRRREIKEQFEPLGADIFYKDDVCLNSVERRLPKGLRQFIAVRKFLKQSNYDAIHIHHCEGMPSILFASILERIPIRVSHSHVGYSESYHPGKFNLKVKLYLNWRNRIIKMFSTHFWGCSNEACKAMFGNKYLKNKQTEVIYNGIDFNRFNSQGYNIDETMSQYNLSNDNVNFIFVGRFDPQKNPIFLINMFNELFKLRKNVHLTIVGHGDLGEEMKELVKRNNLQNMVQFLPHNSNIPELLSCMDYLVVPSLYEGLGIVFIEAQVMGVPCFASDRVPEEAQLGICEFPSLELGEEGYAKYIHNYINNDKSKILNQNKVSKYNILNTVDNLQKIYSIK